MTFLLFRNERVFAVDDQRANDPTSPAIRSRRLFFVLKHVSGSRCQFAESGNTRTWSSEAILQWQAQPEILQGKLLTLQTFLRLWFYCWQPL